MTTIQKLSLENLNEVMHLIKEAIVEMEKHYISQWDEIYPDETKIREDLSKQFMFGWIEDSSIKAIVVLNEIEHPLYAQIDWKNKNTIPLVIHRLCVRPKFQGQGLAKKIVQFAEKYAKENNYKSIRLDAFIENTFAEKLYRKLDYKERGIISFRKGNFYCFEKDIL